MSVVHVLYDKQILLLLFVFKLHVYHFAGTPVNLTPTPVSQVLLTSTRLVGSISRESENGCYVCMCLYAK